MNLESGKVYLQSHYDHVLDTKRPPERNIKELGERVDTLQKDMKSLENENADLKSIRSELQGVIENLERENQLLRETMGSSPSSSVDSWFQEEPYGFQSENIAGDGSSRGAQEQSRRR